MEDELSGWRPSTPLIWGVACTALALGFVMSAFAWTTSRMHGHEVAKLRGEVTSLRDELDGITGRNAKLAKGLAATNRRLRRKEVGIAPLASRVLKSVFTIETDEGLGSGFAAWVSGGRMYVITANHVVSHNTRPFVSVTRKGSSWTGEIVVRDPANDLALIRVSGRPSGAAPLWQQPARRPPRTGDQLLLVGSPYGLEGTVTTGIVSRVTRHVIQTDAAANPGNSGGPATDRQGRIVGILVAGGGENINFAVPIARACVKLRHC
jgi:S1-C subfamily serine protease